MEKYIAKWHSRETGATTDITSRCGGVSTSDDLDSLAVTMSMDVQQSRLTRITSRLRLPVVTGFCSIRTASW